MEIIIISVVLLLSFVVNIIQYRRQIQLESTIENIQYNEKTYYDFFERVYLATLHSYQNLERLDKRGAFKNDDEVGFTFKSMFTILNDLKLFMDDARQKLEAEEEK